MSREGRKRGGGKELLTYFSRGSCYQLLPLIYSFDFDKTDEDLEPKKGTTYVGNSGRHLKKV